MFGSIGAALGNAAKDFGSRIGNAGLTDGMRAQIGEDAFKKFRQDQLWNMGASLQGFDGGRDPYAGLPSAQQQMGSLDMNQRPYQMGQGGMLGLGFGRRAPRGQRGGGLLDVGGY
jgi:hypothetical protein